jgi:hypothetical protein
MGEKSRSEAYLCGTKCIEIVIRIHVPRKFRLVWSLDSNRNSPTDKPRSLKLLLASKNK